MQQLTAEQYTVGLAWDNTSEEVEQDLDVSCTFFDKNGMVLDAVYFKKTQSNDKSVSHSSDNKNGKGTGDDESMLVSLKQVHSAVKALVISVSCYTKHDLSSVPAGKLELRTVAGKTIAGFNFDDCVGDTSLIAFVLYRDAVGNWAEQNIFKSCKGRTFQDFKYEMRDALVKKNIISGDVDVDFKKEPTFDVNKGQIVNVSSLKKIMVGLGWKAGCDVDASCLLMEGKKIYDTVSVSYTHLTLPTIA